MVDFVKWRVVLSSAFLIGYGVSLHDFAHQVYQLKGYHNIVEGGYVGFALMLPFVYSSLRMFYRNVNILLRGSDK